MIPPHRRSPAATLALLVLTAACGGPEDERGSSGLEGVQDTLAEDSAAPGPQHDLYPAPGDSTDGPDGPVSGDTLVDGEDGAEAGSPGILPSWTVERMRSETGGAGVATVTTFEHGRHPEYDRWVIEFGEGPIPGWEVEYVDRPLTLCGSGRQVQPVGEGWLRIDLQPARGHTEDGEATLEPEIATPGLEQGLRVYRTCDFEGHVELVLALRSPEPFRAFELGDPARLVVDVRTNRAGERP